MLKIFRTIEFESQYNLAQIQSLGHSLDFFDNIEY